ncbi:MAG: hypothetical protein RR382_10145 [Tannerellaceae bacterium]
METERQTKKQVLTKAADWIKENRYWLLALGVFLGAGLLALWALDAHRSAQLSALRTEYAATTEKLRAAEVEAEVARLVLTEKTEALAALQTDNDQKIKVVTLNAYKEARTIPDDRITDSLNALITGARGRNEDRDRAANK